MSTETKTLSFRVKDLGTVTDASGQEFGQIEALGAVFDNVDEDRDSILPGSFKRTIKNAKDRAASRQKKYLAPMLWQHDTHEIIGGWYELSEADAGLLGKGDISLATQRGREYYALAKAGMTDQFSIIYDIPAGGAKYRKDGVRELSELRLFSIDPVTFAANDATALVNVKNAARKSADDTADTITAVGNTKGPLGPRDEAWDGGKAEDQIWAAAYDEDAGTVNKTLASKYFMARTGDGTEKGDYSYPFWYVGSSPHISVGAVKAIAGALSGSRGADAPDALKPKVEALYNRINAKYPDDPPLTPPWQSDNQKGRSMRNTKAAKNAERQQKTFQEHYAEEQCEDLLEDWCEVVLSAFTAAVYDAFSIGDQPEADINDALDGLKTAVSEWVDEAVKYGLSDYLDDLDGDYNPGLSRMQNGGSRYGYMSRQTPLHRKAMTAGDATTGGFTADHVDKLHGAADKANKAVEKHASALHDAAESVKSLIGQASKAAKAGRAFSAANEQALSDHADDLDTKADALTKAMSRHMKSVNSVADDLATVLQGSEAAYTTDPGDAGSDQEGKSNTRHAPSGYQPTRAPQSRIAAPSSLNDTPSEDEVGRALAELKRLRTVRSA